MPVAERKTPSAQVAVSHDHHVCPSGVFAPVGRRKYTTSASCRSGPASVQVGVGCTNMQLQPPPTPTRPCRTSMHMSIVGVTDAAINATCIRAHHLTTACPYASCTDCCIGHYNGTPMCAGPDVVRQLHKYIYIDEDNFV